MFNIPVILPTPWSQGHRHWGFVTLFGCRAEVRAEPPGFEEVE